ncbi:MAG: hypothetical protein ACRD96_02920, partial [Bryobacteraceae bacterium]
EIGRRPARGRRAVLIVTDNEGLNYQTPDEDVVRALFEADAVLNAIVVKRGRRPAAPRPGQFLNPDFTPSNVFGIAERTGGEAFEGGKIGASFREMIERIRSRYSLHYAAPEAPGGGLRRIRVELAGAARRKHADAVVRARAGYYSRR